MKKNLIYYCCTGEKYTDYCVLSVKSLLKKGKFTGDIFILCSEEDFYRYSFIKETNVFVFPVINSEFSHMERIKSVDFINNHAPNYQQIMYLDADTLIKNNINPMFCAKDCLMYAKEGERLRPELPKGDVFYTYCYNDEEYEKFKYEEVVNSGTFCVDSKLFKNLMYTWDSILVSSGTKKFGIDQAAFNKMIYLNLFKAKQWSYKYIYFLFGDYDGAKNNEMVKDNAIINHYLLNSKLKMQEDYKCL